MVFLVMFRGIPSLLTAAMTPSAATRMGYVITIFSLPHCVLCDELFDDPGSVVRSQKVRGRSAGSSPSESEDATAELENLVLAAGSGGDDAASPGTQGTIGSTSFFIQFTGSSSFGVSRHPVLSHLSFGDAFGHEWTIGGFVVFPVLGLNVSQLSCSHRSRVSVHPGRRSCRPER